MLPPIDWDDEKGFVSIVYSPLSDSPLPNSSLPSKDSI